MSEQVAEAVKYWRACDRAYAAHLNKLVLEILIARAAPVAEDAPKTDVPCK